MRLVLATLLLMPAFAFAASEGSTPPKPTNTTKTCKGVKVWSEKKKRCVKPQNAALDQDALYGAVRELAYAERYKDAQGVLALMADQNDDRVLTYWGFTSRKMGHSDLANAYYQKAIARNPGNLLARSYMAQGFIADGRRDEAIAQYREIQARGGTGTWAEASLRQALETGQTFNY